MTYRVSEGSIDSGMLGLYVYAVSGLVEVSTRLIVTRV